MKKNRIFKFKCESMKDVDRFVLSNEMSILKTKGQNNWLVSASSLFEQIRLFLSVSWRIISLLSQQIDYTNKLRMGLLEVKFK